MRASPRGKAQASQACTRGFESRRPLQHDTRPIRAAFSCPGFEPIRVEIRQQTPQWGVCRISGEGACAEPLSAQPCHKARQARESRRPLQIFPRSLLGPLFCIRGPYRQHRHLHCPAFPGPFFCIARSDGFFRRKRPRRLRRSGTSVGNRPCGKKLSIICNYSRQRGWI